MAGVTLQGVAKRFGSFTAVEGIDLAFREGELTALLGPSGCGKTTLLRMIAGLEAPSAGRVLLGDRDITDLPAHQRRFGMVFQSFALFPHLSVAENVSYALAIEGVAKAERRARAVELLDLVQLTGLGDRRIGALSGGQRQRVAIARALAQEPAVFLLDEPMSALDAKLREEMQVELRMLQQRIGITTIVVTHDQREAMTMADTIVVMSKGVAEQVGSPQDIYHRPATAFVAGFIGQANFLTGTLMGSEIALDGGIGTLSPAQPPRFRDGARLLLACRPEAVALAGEGGAENGLPATVSFVRDVGPRREIHLRAGDLALIAELGAGDRTAYAAGDRVTAVLPAPALRIFPEDGRPGQPGEEAA
ncbi:MAG: ABC transporter ATP-binding protein [Pseudomonadota bacterium]